MDSDAEVTVPSGRAEVGRTRSRSGGAASRQASESELFSPPARTKSEELKRVQLLEGSKKLKKIGIREASKVFKEYATAAGGRPVPSTDAQNSQGSATPAATDNVNNNLLQILVSEIARMRCTLDSVAQDRTLLAEVQRSNKLLALSLVCGHRIEIVRSDDKAVMKEVGQHARAVEAILKSV